MAKSSNAQVFLECRLHITQNQLYVA